MTLSDKERERQIGKCMGRCKHFNGVQNKKCEVGIDYETFRVEGGGLGLPCLKHLGEHLPKQDCPQAVYPTVAEAEQELADREQSWRNICTAREAIVVHLGEPWKNGMAGSGGIIDCPVCKAEKSLHFSRAGYNGHIHAKCATANCVSWME